MKIFHGTTYGVEMAGESTLWVGRRQYSVDSSALSGLVDGRLCRASVSQVGDDFKFSGEGVKSSFAHSDQAAVVFFDCPLVNSEPFSIRPVRGDCRALLAEAEVYMISSGGVSPGAAILTRCQGLLVMEPGSCIEVKESYRRFPLLDWIDHWRGVHSGTTRFVLRVHVSFDGNSVKVEKQPDERVIS